MSKLWNVEITFLIPTDGNGVKKIVQKHTVPDKKAFRIQGRSITIEDVDGREFFYAPAYIHSVKVEPLNAE